MKEKKIIILTICLIMVLNLIMPVVALADNKIIEQKNEENADLKDGKNEITDSNKINYNNEEIAEPYAEKKKIEETEISELEGEREGGSQKDTDEILEKVDGEENTGQTQDDEKETQSEKIDKQNQCEQEKNINSNIKEIEIEQEKQEEKNNSFKVGYNTHIEDYGWENNFSKKDGEIAGTEGKSKRIEAIKITLGNKIELTKDTFVKYQTYIQDIGWQEWKKNGEIAGTEGQSKRIEAIKIKLEGIKGISILYRTHVQDLGWTKWANNGEISGIEGENKRIEAIQIKIVDNPELNISYTYNKEKNTVMANIESNKMLKNINDIGWNFSEDNYKAYKEYEKNGTYNINVEDEDDIKKELKIEINQLIKPQINYQTHVQDIGWQDIINENEIAGTTGQSKGVEAIKINLDGVDNVEATIRYKSYVANLGWQNWIKSGETSGTTGKSKSIEAIQIETINLYNYSIEYRVHISNYGWQKWRKNGETAGLIGQKQRIEAIQIRIICKGSETSELEVSYQTHVEDYGWQNEAIEGLISGTEGKAKRLEALKINLMDNYTSEKIKYRAHVQDIGWQGWVSNGKLAGTTGQSKRIEAIQIKLEGTDSYTVEYKVHIQDYGWSDWMIDGEIAGTTGQSRRIEAIQIRIVPKYYRQYKGIDVSEHNGEINWNSVKKSGVQFAMIRCAYRGYRTGKIVEDSQFRNNINGASANGIKVGLYFFSQATNIAEAIEEANYTISLARQYNCITYPISIDSELSGADYNDGRADGLNTALRTNIVVAFCNQIKNNNYIPMVYASRDWLYNNLEVSKISNYDIWLAHYTESPSKKSNYKYNYTMWQYTSSGSVYGINGRVDINIGYKKY